MGQGDPKGSCGAKTRADGTCGKPPGWGTSHPGVGRCKHHGGASPQAELSGQLALARADAIAMGNPLPIEPHDAILQCIRIAAGEVRYAGDQIADLSLTEAVGPVVTTVEKEGGGGDDEGWSGSERKEGPPALHIWIQVRHQAMDRLVSYSTAALKAGVEERKVRIAEQLGDELAQAIRNLLGELGVPLEDPKTREVVVRHLRLLPGGAEAAA